MNDPLPLRPRNQLHKLDAYRAALELLIAGQRVADRTAAMLTRLVESARGERSARL